MQQVFDNTSGYFNDVPYFSPVETTVFYNAVQNCRLHKLPGHLMVKPRSLPFFACEDSDLSQVLQPDTKPESEKRSSKPVLGLPTFRTDFASAQPLLKSSGADYIVIREKSASLSPCADDREADCTKVCSLNLDALNCVWTGLLLYLHGCGGGSAKYVVEYVDLAFGQESGVGESLVSLLLTGVASILHGYYDKAQYQSALDSVTIEFSVLRSEAGSSVGDDLQFFIEKELKLPVSRVSAKGSDSAHEELLSAAHCVECSEVDWLETVCAEVVDVHEMLCDREPDSSEGQLSSPVCLLIVPHVPRLRSVLSGQILDSYSSEPLRVNCEAEWSIDELSVASPVVFICSSVWLIDHLNVATDEQLLRRLNVKVVFHAGVCELADTVAEEVARCVIALRSCGVRWEEMRVARHRDQSHLRSTAFDKHSPAERGTDVYGSALLLLFRRFLVRFSPGSKQPYTVLPRGVFCSQRAWFFFNKAVHTLRLAGVLSVDQEASPEAIELSVLGRFLSFRLRIQQGTERTYGAFTLADGKVVLWAFLFRQPMDAARELIEKSHVFSSWVGAALKHFCDVYNLRFDFSDAVPHKDLVRQLAFFGFCDGNVSNRVHYILSSSGGARFPLRSHFTGAAPTSCRGWYEQAPLNAGLSTERKEVNVLCPPPKAAYCEVEAAGQATSACLQCPLELSYPIIVVHSVLHISLHNLCVFNETVEPSAVMPLPTSLLESSVMQFLVKRATKGNAGLWLDGVMNETTLTASDASVLAAAPLKGRQHIQYCEREAFHRKRRRSDGVNGKLSDASAFQGLQPRTAAERSAVEELVDLIKTIGREKAEKVFRGKKGFNFLESSHELHPYYLYHLRQ